MDRQLPLPSLTTDVFDGIVALSDDPLFESAGIRIASTSRQGGVSEGDYAALNLGGHVEDDPSCVDRNRSLILHALGIDPARCVFANQVHGDRIAIIPKHADLSVIEDVKSDAMQQADGILVGCLDVAALLCFADCVPVIIASPTGAFAVVHAGWRGVMSRIAPKAVKMLASPDLGIDSADPSGFNVYIGPHIHSECFEISEEICRRFIEGFGGEVAPDERHVSLSRALRISLAQEGILPERIVDADICTKCHPDEYFSYRASGGVCGRHAAIAFRDASACS